MPRRLAKAAASEPNPDPREVARAPRAGDMARQIGTGFFKMADVIDECPPLAKLFEGGFLERRFQEVFQFPAAHQLPSAASTGNMMRAGTDEEDVESDDPPRLKSCASGARDGDDEGGASSESRPLKVDMQKRSSSASGVFAGGRGRRGTRGSGTGGNEETESWPGLEQALRASEKEVGKKKQSKGKGKGGGMRGRPAQHKAKDESAKRGRKPLPPVPPAFAFPPAPPPRRAAAEALHRISSSSSAPSATSVSSGVPKQSAMTATETSVSAGHKKLPATSVRETSSTGTGNNASSVKKGATNHRKESFIARDQKTDRGGAAATAADANASANAKPKEAGEGATTKPELLDSSAPAAAAVAAPLPGSRNSGSGGGSASTEARLVDDAAAEATARTETGATAITLEGGGPTSGGGGSGATRRRRSDEEMLKELDRRIFRRVEAGECQEDGCEVREVAHCHRGPACDCTRNRDTYLWPSELQSMTRHQERHREWNTRPAFGKRVMVEFEEGKYYPGTINTEGESARDRKHSKGRWGVLFDDCTKDRFHDGASDVMISSHPRPTTISEELRNYYAKQENGKRLLAGVRILTAADLDTEDDSGATERKRASVGSGKAGGKEIRSRNSAKKPRKASPTRKAKTTPVNEADGGELPKKSRSTGGIDPCKPKKKKSKIDERDGASGRSKAIEGRDESTGEGADERDSQPEGLRGGPADSDDGSFDGDGEGPGRKKIGNNRNKKRRSKHGDQSGGGGGKRKKEEGRPAEGGASASAEATEGIEGTGKVKKKHRSGAGVSTGSSKKKQKRVKQADRERRADEENVVASSSGHPGASGASSPRTPESGEERVAGDAGGDSHVNLSPNHEVSSSGGMEDESRGHEGEQHEFDEDAIVPGTPGSPGWAEEGEGREENVEGEEARETVDRDAAASPLASVADLRATVVAESGGATDEEQSEGKGEGPEMETEASPGWVSPPQSADAWPSADAVKQTPPQQSTTSPTTATTPAAATEAYRSPSTQHPTQRLTIPEEEEEEEEEEGDGIEEGGDANTVGRSADGRGEATSGRTVVVTAAAAACQPPDSPNIPKCRDAGDGVTNSSTAANVVPVLPPPSRASTADPHTLAAAHVLISGLGL